MNRYTALLAMLFVVFGVAACNTVRGVGEDVQGGGEAISNTAEEAQREIFD